MFVGGIRADDAANGSRMPHRYAVITPVRDELDSIGRLRGALEAQTVRPSSWHIVDTGSGDGTLELASSFAQQISWIECHSIDGGASRQRGGPVVLALEQGLHEIGDSHVDIVVKVDADVTMGRDVLCLDPRRVRGGSPPGDRKWVSPGAQRWRMEAEARHARLRRGSVSRVPAAMPRRPPPPGEEPWLGRHRRGEGGAGGLAHDESWTSSGSCTTGRSEAASVRHSRHGARPGGQRATWGIDPPTSSCGQRITSFAGTRRRSPSSARTSPPRSEGLRSAPIRPCGPR